MKLEYVISAPLYGLFPNYVLDKLDHKDLIKENLNAFYNIATKKIQDSCKNYEPSTSVLFNGFTEERQIPNFDFYGRLGNKLYADSGGLQIVTRGMAVTDEIKDQIYKVQTYADYAMCFDVISLRNQEEEKERTKNERALYANKMFHQNEHEEAGRLTGLNIKRQIETFKKLQAKTKVIIIVQGNESNDMLVYFDQIIAQLSDEDYEFVGGFATADTCMGNGNLQTVKMLRAAREISRNTHPAISGHYHLLGIGSVFRMAPVIFLKQANYLDNIDYISYDSSSHSQSFAFGHLKLQGGTEKLGDTYSKFSEDHFRNLYQYFDEYLKNHISEDSFVDIIFRDRSKEWSISKINQWALEKGNDRDSSLAFTMKAAHLFYQVADFCGCLNGLFDGSFKLPREYWMFEDLKKVHDEESMDCWMTHQGQQKKKISKQIIREENVTALPF